MKKAIISPGCCPAHVHSTFQGVQTTFKQVSSVLVRSCSMTSVPRCESACNAIKHGGCWLCRWSEQCEELCVFYDLQWKDSRVAESARVVLARGSRRFWQIEVA